MAESGAAAQYRRNSSRLSSRRMPPTMTGAANHGASGLCRQLAAIPAPPSLGESNA
jgi:hypothetical protein